MTITREGRLFYFIYRNVAEANDACDRMSHLKPHIVSKGGHLNAVVIDLDKMPTMGEMQ